MLGMTWKWNHIIFILLGLIYFAWRNVFKVHPCLYLSEFQSFLRLNNHCPYVPHFVHLFIQPCQLGSFHLLDIVNDATVNIGIK